MDELIEPPPPSTGEAIPFLGETKLYESILDIAAEGELVLNVSGTWIGRRPEDATYEEARHYVQSKAFRMGQEMRQIQLGLPGAVGGGTVTGPNLSSGSPKPGAGSTVTSDSSLQPGSKENKGFDLTKNKDGSQEKDGDGQPEDEAKNEQPIFVPAKVKKSEEPATGINLSGSFEAWGVASSQTIQKARLEFSGLTAQQMKQILQRIPSAFKAILEIEYKEGEEQ